MNMTELIGLHRWTIGSAGITFWKHVLETVAEKRLDELEKERPDDEK